MFYWTDWFPPRRGVIHALWIYITFIGGRSAGMGVKERRMGGTDDGPRGEGAGVTAYCSADGVDPGLRSHNPPRTYRCAGAGALLRTVLLTVRIGACDWPLIRNCAPCRVQGGFYCIVRLLVCTQWNLEIGKAIHLWYRLWCIPETVCFGW